jgi:nucleoside-diphosphate-sugar epimerase
MGPIVVTGAEGFIGRACIERLLREQYDVRPVARETARSEQGAFYSADLVKPSSWTGVLRGAEAVIHLAGHAHAAGALDEVALTEMRRVNVDGAVNLGRESARAGIRRFVFVSSVKAMGNATTEGNPYTEEDEPIPKDPYGEAKLAAERELTRIAARTGMELVIVRPPMVYGPGVKGNFLRLLGLVERGIPLPLKNARNQRSLVYLFNLVDFLVRCVSHPAASGHTFLVSDDHDVSSADLVRSIAAAMSKKAHLFPLPISLSRVALRVLGREEVWWRLFGSLQVRPDRAKRLLGWRPEFELNHGIAEATRWYLGSRHSVSVRRF